MKKHKFIVAIEIPEGVNITRMRRYIATAVSCECGLLHRQDPLTNINRDSIKVVHATRVKAADLLLELKLKDKRNISMSATHTKNYGGTSNYGK